MRPLIAPQAVLLAAILLAAILSLIPTIATPAQKMEGTYTHPRGMLTLDLKPGGKANFTMMGESFACTYRVNKDKLVVDCTPRSEFFDFVINSDGSLTGYVGTLKKSEAVAPAIPQGPG